MTQYTCPAGHVSAAGDYCDTCGAPIEPQATGVAAGGGGGAVQAAGGGAGRRGAPSTAAPSSPAPDGAAAPKPCPYCGTDNAEEALFCESCGYDFTTGTPPRPPDPPSSLDLDAPSSPDPASSPESALAPSPSLDPDSGASPAAGQPAGASASRSAASPGAAAPVAASPGAEFPGAAPNAPDGGSGRAVDADVNTGQAQAMSPAPPPVAPALERAYVVEIWIDPDWHLAQESEVPAPSPGLPDVVLVTTQSVLVGRTSLSRGIKPEVDCGSDIGVSRRHAQLTTDGRRWWVEDLQSANGTYVGPASGPLPAAAIPAGRHELADDDRIYVGAWTRLVLREATPEEQAG